MYFQVCKICKSESAVVYLDIFGEINSSKTISAIISKHLWFEFKPSHEQQMICNECWHPLYEFNIFYEKVEKINKCDSGNASAKTDLSEDPFGDDPFTENDGGIPKEAQSESLTEVKEEPLDDLHVDNLVVFDGCGQDIDKLQSEQDLPEQVVTRKSTRIQSKSKPKTTEQEHITSSLRSERKSNTATVVYKTDQWSSGDDKGSYSQSEESHADNDDSDEDIKLKSNLRERRKRKSCEAESNTLATKSDGLSRDLQQTASRKSARIQCKPLSKTNKCNEQINTSVERLRRRDTTGAVYKTDKGGYIQSDESSADNDDSDEDIELESKLRERRRRKSSNSEDDDLDIKPDDSEEEQHESDAPLKTSRAKRKKDKRLFEHVDEFICYICPERVEFERFYHATVHYKKHHKEPAYIKCKICDKRCYTPGNFISHVGVHTDPDKYRCQICGKQNDQQVALAKHMRIHRPEMEEKLPTRCRLCPRRFATEKKRDRHEKHHNRKPMEKPPRIVGRDEEVLEFYKRIICEICDQQRMVDVHVPDVEYDNMQDLKKHMRDVHNDKGYLRCHMCDKKCNIRSMLLIHKDFHLHPDKYRCDICGNVYQNLPKHREGAHTTPGEASFCCEHCGKALTSEKSLKSHVERKHAVKDVTCDICHKPFSKGTLESHKRVVHESASYMCTHCPRMFKSKFSLNRHQEEHEEKVRERVKCLICGVTFKHKYILTKHLDSVHTKEAPVSCDVCGKMFKSKHHLWSHKSDTCNNRRYDCTICGRVFKVKVRLTEHMTTHTGKSLYQCTFCPMTFSFQSILYTHRKKAHYEQWLELQAKREEGVKFKVLEAPA